MARKKQSLQKTSSGPDAATPLEATPNTGPAEAVMVQESAPESPIEDTLPDRFFEKDVSADSIAGDDPTQSSSPPVATAPVRYVALTMVKLKGRYYSPDSPLPPELLDDNYIDAFLAAGAIAPEEALS
jgi:hypothetical protein